MPEGWPSDPHTLTDVADEDWAARLSFPGGLDEMMSCLKRLAETHAEPLDALLAECKEIGAAFVRNRDTLFSSVATKLNALYAELCIARVARAIPLVIVDEAHNWKNGPRQGSNGYEGFRRWIAPWTRRALLLTATPFQLRPQEMIEILKVGDHLAPCADEGENAVRRSHLEHHREKVIRTALDQSAAHSQHFARAWARLSRQAAVPLGRIWHDPRLTAARQRLIELAARSGALTLAEVNRVVDEAVADPDFLEERDILKEGLRLHAFNADLSRELGELVVRHRRRTEHRLVQVGAEYEDAELAHGRKDILSVAIAAELSKRAEALGGEKSLEHLRSRITRREATWWSWASIASFGRWHGPPHPRRSRSLHWTPRSSASDPTSSTPSRGWPYATASTSRPTRSIACS